MPPPLPPRKSSPTLEQSQNSALNSAHTSQPLLVIRNGNKSLVENGLNEAQSVMNLSHHTEIPQIPKSNSMHEIFCDTNLTDSETTIELSTPETIYGIIDSRYNFCNIDSKSQTRHQSVPSTGNHISLNCPVKSSTTPNISNQQLEHQQHQQQELGYVAKEPPYENIRIDLPPKGRQNPLTAKDNVSVSYENLNMDYIKKLVNEGYSKDAVIRALGITRNNVDMACDILHEFGTKHG